MVKAADHMKGRVMSLIGVNALLCIIDWGGMTMIRDPAGRRAHVHDRLEQMADDRIKDDQPMRRDSEREPDHQINPNGVQEV
jgi:hypothetical protein